MRNAVAALGASMSAIVVARLFTGAAPDFAVVSLPYPDAQDNLLCLGLGLFAGALGTIYNYLLLDALAIADRMARLPVELRAGLVGATIGALAWFAPPLAGGGDGLTQSVLNGATPGALLPLLFIIRLFLSSASYAAGTPGGLFAPLLVLGAQMGFFFGALTHPTVAEPNTHAILFAVVGMAALFTAIVRAPLTGIILVTEMTGTSIALLPMLAACFTAMALAMGLGSAPIYEFAQGADIAARRQTAARRGRRHRRRHLSWRRRNLRRRDQSAMKATLAAAMTPAASQPPAAIRHGRTKSPMIFLLVAIRSIAAIIGAARTPFRTALQ